MGCQESTNLGDVKCRRAEKEKAEGQQVSIFPTSSSWSPKKEKLGWNPPVEFAYGADYSQCELRFSYFDGHSIQQGQQKDMRIFKPLASSSVLPTGFQPWTWLLGLGLMWRRALGWHKQYSHQWRLGQEWSEEWQVAKNECWKFWLCKMRKKYQVTKKPNKLIRKKYQIRKKQKADELDAIFGWKPQQQSPSVHQTFLGEKKQTEMESEPSNCMFYLFSFLFIKEKGPKSNNNLLCLILQNTLPFQIHENEIPFSPTVLYQLFCLWCKRGLNTITYRWHLISA